MAGRGCSLHEEDYDVIDGTVEHNNGRAAADLTRDEKRALGSWSGPATKGASGEGTKCCRCKEQPASVRENLCFIYMHTGINI